MSLPALDNLRKPEPPLRSESTKLSSAQAQSHGSPIGDVEYWPLVRFSYKFFCNENFQVILHKHCNWTGRSPPEVSRRTTAYSATLAAETWTMTMLRTVFRCSDPWGAVSEPEPEEQLWRAMEDVAGAELWETVSVSKIFHEYWTKIVHEYRTFHREIFYWCIDKSVSL